MTDLSAPESNPAPKPTPLITRKVTGKYAKLFDPVQRKALYFPVVRGKIQIADGGLACETATIAVKLSDKIEAELSAKRDKQDVNT